MSLINPMHPAAILITLRKAMAYTLTMASILPAGASVTLSLAPPAGTIWVLLLINRGTPRDAVTGNPIWSPLIYTTSYHAMQRSPIVEYMVNSVNDYLLPAFQEFSVDEPLIVTFTNASAGAVTMDSHFAIAVIPEIEREHYYVLWRGVHNLLYALGKVSLDDMKGQILETLIAGGVK